MRYGLFLVLLAGAACAGGARYVKTDPAGGVVAAPSNSPEDRQKANALMESKCPRGYVVDEEHEAHAPTTSDIMSRAPLPTVGPVRTDVSQTREPAKEWQIAFHCN